MAIQQILENINAKALRTDVPVMDIGDQIDVHCRIVEGDKERVQVFSGVLIARSGRGINQMITVRRIVDETGVERIFPVHSPNVAAVELLRRGKVRRAKLYYLRRLAGKATRIKEKKDE